MYVCMYVYPNPMYIYVYINTLTLPPSQVKLTIVSEVGASVYSGYIHTYVTLNLYIYIYIYIYMHIYAYIGKICYFE
jgi:hypothetical protein